MIYENSEILEMMMRHQNNLRNQVSTKSAEARTSHNLQSQKNSILMSNYKVSESEDDDFPFFNISSNVKVKK